MQRRLAVAAALLLAALTFSAPAEARVNPQNAGLQVALRAWGTYLGRIDGIAGPMTARAVRVFQRRAGLPVDGVPGKRTRRAMGRLGKPLYGKRAMHRGMVGWDVAVLQFMLARRGSSPGIVDGYFGKETGRALRRFQRRHGLHADSVAGPATRRALGGGVAASGRAGPRSGRTVKAKLNYWARVYTMSPRFIRAIAWVESGWQKGVVSSKGARGVMQVMPGTWSYVAGGPDRPSRPPDDRREHPDRGRLHPPPVPPLQRQRPPGPGRVQPGPGLAAQARDVPRDAPVRPQRAGDARPRLTTTCSGRSTVGSWPAWARRRDNPVRRPRRRDGASRRGLCSSSSARSGS